MNTTLIAFVVLYLLVTLAIGVWAGSRVKNTADFAVAGRSLPLIMVVTTTFATWFGAETVMGIPAKFVQGGLNAIVERRPIFLVSMLNSESIHGKAIQQDDLLVTPLSSS